MNNHNGWWRSIFPKKKVSQKNPHSVICQILMDWWKVTSTWHYHCNCKSVTLELHSSCSYIIGIELHELHMYTISCTMNCIHCNSCDLSDNTRVYRNMLSCNELQMLVATEKSSYKANCKSPYFFIVSCDGDLESYNASWSNKKGFPFHLFMGNVPKVVQFHDQKIY